MTTLGGDVWRWRRLTAAIEDLDHALTTDEHIEVVRAVPVMLAEIERLTGERDAARAEVVALIRERDTIVRTNMDSRRSLCALHDEQAAKIARVEALCDDIGRHHVDHVYSDVLLTLDDVRAALAGPGATT